MLIDARPHAAGMLGVLVIMAAVSVPLTSPRPAAAFGRHSGFGGARFGFRPFLARSHVFLRAPVIVRPPSVFGSNLLYAPIGGYPGPWVWVPPFWNGWVWVPGR